MRMHKNGFSLVELSIVLVILGLLTGGILAGRSLIRASELRSIQTEFNRYYAATQGFRDKYFYLPGDMLNATSIWGALGDGGVGACPATAGTGTETCNGNGDKALTATAPNNERFGYWKQLANAGLIEGSYTGIEGSAGNAAHAIPGVNVPRGKLSDSGWTVYSASGPPTANYFDGTYGNFYFYGKTTTSNGATNVRILKPEEMWNLDTKMDDGMPGRGKVTTLWVTSCTNGADGSALDATYELDVTTAQCTPLFLNLF